MYETDNKYDDTTHCEDFAMNISETEVPIKIVAKTCGCKKNKRIVTYQFIDSYHSLCLDKKDLIFAELSQVSYPMSLCHLPNVLSRYSDTAVFCSSI